MNNGLNKFENATWEAIELHVLQGNIFHDGTHKAVRPDEMRAITARIELLEAIQARVHCTGEKPGTNRSPVNTDQPTESRRDRTRRLHGSPAFTSLQFFYFLCRRDEVSREMVEVCTADLKKDVREMIGRGMSDQQIATALWWQAVQTAVPILWDGVRRIAVAVLPGVRTLSGLLRRNDK